MASVSRPTFGAILHPAPAVDNMLSSRSGRRRARAAALPEVVRRGLDIGLAGTLLLITAPFLLLLTILVRVSSPGPALFRQVRVGSAGRTFRILKLRTMVHDAEMRLRLDPDLRNEYLASHFKVAADRDPRITPIGRFLRRTSLDELPQLLNVLLGHMSMVGPRPVVPRSWSCSATCRRRI
jgi:lipopolysaccharide/colanic/teichoic acid biosynthesis glycosyltransferase